VQLRIVEHGRHLVGVLDPQRLEHEPGREDRHCGRVRSWERHCKARVSRMVVFSKYRLSHAGRQGGKPNAQLRL
jgi:hypothetical protein